MPPPPCPLSARRKESTWACSSTTRRTTRISSKLLYMVSQPEHCLDCCNTPTISCYHTFVWLPCKFSSKSIPQYHVFPWGNSFVSCFSWIDVIMHIFLCRTEAPRGRQSFTRHACVHSLHVHQTHGPCQRWWKGKPSEAELCRHVTKCCNSHHTYNIFLCCKMFHIKINLNFLIQNLSYFQCCRSSSYIVFVLVYFF